LQQDAFLPRVKSQTIEPIERRLAHHATSIAQSNALEVIQLERDIAELQEKISVLEARSGIGRLALDRLKRYEARSEDAFYCPWCWIEFERRQRLVATDRKFDPLDFRSDDTLHCIYCGNDWPVPPQKGAGG
jgi:hypothetical protein